jgi:ribonuclease J
MTPNSEDLWFIPLGGCGEIGMNFNLYGHDGQWLIVDCGLTFSETVSNANGSATQSSSGSSDGTSRQIVSRDVQMADPAFIADRKNDIAGMIITHAHEDHIGAVQYLWPQLQCTVFTTPLTAHVLRRKLAEAQLDDVPIVVVNSGQIADIGPFNVEWIQMTHSIPEPHSLLIKTAAGKVFHSGDWKLDNAPVVGKPYDRDRCQQLQHEQIDAMVCDSTNATVSGHSRSESELYRGLKSIVEQASGRVVVTCFGSNLARVATLARIASETDRHLGLLGRSMIEMVNAGRATGLLQMAQPGVDSQHLGYLPRETVLLLATGSQGEPRTALNRLSTNSFRDMHLEPGDTVVFSSRVIPGNEDIVAALIARLESMGVVVITESTAELPIHASGHPASDELRQMFSWVKPKVVIPVHGEAEHMQANAELADHSGIAHQLHGKNGDLFVIAPEPALKSASVQSGRLALRGKNLDRV